MGSYYGHVYEAIAFILLALWWMCNSFPRHIRAVQNGDEYKGCFSYRWPGTKIPIESIVKLLISIAGFLVELLNDGAHFVSADGKSVIQIGHLLHMSIYGLMILHSVIDLATQLGAPLPNGLDALSFSAAFAWYGLAFAYHSQEPNKDAMSSVIHQLPTYGLYVTAAAILVEAAKPSCFIAHFVRIIGVLMIGTWSWQAAHLLYFSTPFPGTHLNTHWDHSKEGTISFPVPLYGFHLCMNMLAATVMYCLIALIVRRCTKTNFRYKRILLDDEENIILSPVTTHRRDYDISDKPK